MYLSKLILNLRSKQVRKDVINPYDMHATLSWAVANAEEERVLWRLEDDRRTPTLLVQTLTPPDWNALLIRHHDYAQVDSKSPKHVELELELGQLLRFRLRANPTVTKNGKRYGLSKLEEQLEWLTRQGKRHGFEVPGAIVSSSDWLSFKKSGVPHTISLQAVTYDGHLRVQDPERLHVAIERGLGHAKALGFGLLSIAKG